MSKQHWRGNRIENVKNQSQSLYKNIKKNIEVNFVRNEINKNKEQATLSNLNTSREDSPPKDSPKRDTYVTPIRKRDGYLEEYGFSEFAKTPRVKSFLHDPSNSEESSLTPYRFTINSNNIVEKWESLEKRGIVPKSERGPRVYFQKGKRKMLRIAVDSSFAPSSSRSKSKFSPKSNTLRPVTVNKTEIYEKKAGPTTSYYELNDNSLMLEDSSNDENDGELNFNFVKRGKSKKRVETTATIEIIEPTKPKEFKSPQFTSTTLPNQKISAPKNRNPFLEVPSLTEKLKLTLNNITNNREEKLKEKSMSYLVTPHHEVRRPHFSIRSYTPSRANLSETLKSFGDLTAQTSRAELSSRMRIDVDANSSQEIKGLIKKTPNLLQVHGVPVKGL